MNGYQRIHAALKGEKPDKTPVMLHNFMMAAKESDITMYQFRNNPGLMSDVFIASVEKYKIDGVMVDMDTVTLAGAIGVPVDFPVNEPARTHKGCLESLAGLKTLKRINIENYKHIQVWLEAVLLIKSYFKDDIFVRGNCDQAPFTLASMVRGAQNLMLDLMMEEEERIFELLDYCWEASSQFLKLMSQTGCDMLSNGDSPAGPDMISPEMYLKFALPYEQKLATLSHKLNLPYTMHICGDTELILDYMLNMGADALELDYKTDITRVYEKLHNTTCLIGNIDPSGVLALGSPELVRNTTLELLDTYQGSNRFILNAGCAIPAETSSKNLRAMIEVAREY